MISPVVLGGLAAAGLLFVASKKKPTVLPTFTVTGKSGTIYTVKTLSAGAPAKGVNTYRVHLGANPLLEYLHDSNTGRRVLLGAITQGPALTVAKADFDLK